MKDDHINVFYSDEDGGYIADILTGPWAGRLNISKKTRSRNGASLGIRDVQGPDPVTVGAPKTRIQNGLRDKTCADATPI